MEINWKFFQLYSWRRESPEFFIGSGCWFRIFGRGLSFKNGPLTFSERNKFKKIHSLPFGWRWNYLPKIDFVKISRDY